MSGSAESWPTSVRLLLALSPFLLGGAIFGWAALSNWMSESELRAARQQLAILERQGLDRDAICAKKREIAQAQLKLGREDAFRMDDLTARIYCQRVDLDRDLGRDPLMRSVP